MTAVAINSSSLTMTRMGSNALVPFLVLFLALVTNSLSENLNLRPIIGVLTQTPPDSILDLLKDKDYSAYIPASYVKYIQGAGARVVPIFINQDDDYYERIASRVNGILFPGGDVSITSSSGYGAAGAKLYHHAVQAFQEGISLPIWGTCLGFEMITYLAAQDTSYLSSCEAYNKADHLLFQEGFLESRMFSDVSDYTLDYLRYFNTTYNSHGKCLTPESFADSGLSKDFKMLSTSLDFNGIEYVSLIEHNEMPIFGSQFHPEMNAYRWTSDEDHDAIPHDPLAIEVARHFSNFFADQARLNHQKYPSEQSEIDALIFNYDPIYTGGLGSPVTMSYLFR